MPKLDTFSYWISACNCYPNGTNHGTFYTECSPYGNSTRKCDCKTGYNGELCNECAYDYSNNNQNSTFLKCCYGTGTIIPFVSCDTNNTDSYQECDCKQGYFGNQCNSCNSTTHYISSGTNGLQPVCSGSTIFFINYVCEFYFNPILITSSLSL